MLSIPIQNDGCPARRTQFQRAPPTQTLPDRTPWLATKLTARNINPKPSLNPKPSSSMICRFKTLQCSPMVDNAGVDDNDDFWVYIPHKGPAPYKLYIPETITAHLTSIIYQRVTLESLKSTVSVDDAGFGYSDGFTYHPCCHNDIPVTCIRQS
jgi:hypothetical protein